MRPLQIANLSLALLAAAPLVAQEGNGKFTPADPSFSSGVEGSVKVFHMGPYTIPAGRMINGKIVPGEYEPSRGVPAPNPGDVFVTGYDSRIVDVNRVPQDPLKLYLHHAVLISSRNIDLTCAVIGFLLGERFVAAGQERIPISLPDGYGYRMRGSDVVTNLLHIQNFTLQPQTVYYQFSMYVQPVTANLKEVRPWWLDVINCRSSYTISAGTGTHVQQRDIRSPAQKVTVLSIGPHLHCGGTKLELLETASQKVLFSFTNSSCPVQMRGIRVNPPLVIQPNTLLTLKATYQRDPNDPLDAMGIMLGYIVLN